MEKQFIVDVLYFLGLQGMQGQKLKWFYIDLSLNYKA